MSLRSALALGAAALLVVAMHAAALRGLADVTYFPARHILNAWSRDGIAPTPAQWVAARGALQEARRTDKAIRLQVDEVNAAGKGVSVLVT